MSRSANWPLFMGVDIGTSVIKGIVIDQDGSVVAERNFLRDEFSSPEGLSELESNVLWWYEFVNLIKSVLSALGPHQRNLECLAITGMVPNIYATDELGTPFHQAIPYFDTCASEIERQLDEELKILNGDKRVLSKLVWLKSRLASRWSRVSRILTTHTYIVSRLTDQYCIDTVTAKEFGCLLSPSRMGWNHELLASYGFQSDLLPPIFPPAHIAGSLTEEASLVTGLKQGLPVVVGSGDTTGTLIGSCAQERGDAMIYYGTYGCAVLLREDIRTIATEYGSQDKILFEWLASIPRSGYQLSALSKLLYTSSCDINSHSPLEFLDHLAQEESLPGANGVIFVQTLDLPRSEVSTEPRAAIFNMGAGHRLSDIYRAMLEAFGYGLRYQLERLDLSTKPVRYFAAGGGASSSIWRQIVTDITGFEQFYSSKSRSAFGSALIGALSIDKDLFTTIVELQKQELKSSIPNLNYKQVYSERYVDYQQLIEVYNRE